MKTLWMGGLCGVAGTLTGLWAGRQAPGEGYQYLPLFAGAAAFLAGAGLWWLLARPGVYTPWRGAAAGGLLGGALARRS